MRALAALLGLLAVGLVLFALGVFEQTKKPADPAPAGADTDGGAATDGEATLVAGEDAPTAPTAYVVQPLDKPAGLLVLAKRPTSWSTFLTGALRETTGVEYVTWFTDAHDVRDVKSGPGAGPSLGKPLSAAPEGGDLERLDVRILVLDDVDPNALPRSFWGAVSERVAKGETGLWVRAGLPVGAHGEAQTAHPLLSHPDIAPLLPVATADPVAGDPVPGTFAGGVELALTDAGARHPATRITKHVASAYQFWDRRTRGEYAWKPAFVYPVTELRPGATSLVEAKVSPTDRRPALIASAGDVGRVFWQGNFDFGHRTYFSAKGTSPLGVLINRVLWWLAGRAS